MIKLKNIISKDVNEIQSTPSGISNANDETVFLKRINNAKRDADKESQKVDTYMDLNFQFARDNASDTNVIIYKDGEVAGFVSLYEFETSKYQISNLAIKPEFRKLGIAQKTYEYILSKTKEIYSDAYQTPEAKKLWLRMFSKYKIQGYDTKANIYFEVKPSENEDELVSNDPKYTLYSDRYDTSSIVLVISKK